MALGAESAVSHWSVTELSWPDATGSKSRATSRLGVAFPSAVSAASRQLPVSLVSPLTGSLLPGSFLQPFGPQIQVCLPRSNGVEKDSLKRKAPCSLGKRSARLSAQSLVHCLSLVCKATSTGVESKSLETFRAARHCHKVQASHRWILSSNS